jgi:hypothetical protein
MQIEHVRSSVKLLTVSAQLRSYPTLASKIWKCSLQSQLAEKREKVNGNLTVSLTVRSHFKLTVTVITVNE